ncbi:MAG: heme ABC exporter ATP-binding protein CcmA [Dehalococcoidia bacterium]
MTEASEPQWAIELEGVTKTFGHRRVLQGIDLKLGKGQFLTLFGPNGAGKTTLLKTVATLMRPTAGRVTIAGLDPAKQAARVRQSLGFIGHQSLIYEELTAYENLKFYGRMYRVRGLEERIEEVARKVGLERRLHDQVRTLSHGMQKRFSIARAIIHDPALLLLDEPESGLDQHASELLAEILGDPASGERTVLMTTHDLERGLRWGTQVAILAQGKIIYSGPRPEDTALFPRMYQQLTGAKS